MTMKSAPLLAFALAFPSIIWAQGLIIDHNCTRCTTATDGVTSTKPVLSIKPSRPGGWSHAWQDGPATISGQKPFNWAVSGTGRTGSVTSATPAPPGSIITNTSGSTALDRIQPVSGSGCPPSTGYGQIRTFTRTSIDPTTVRGSGTMRAPHPCAGSTTRIRPAGKHTDQSGQCRRLVVQVV